MSLEDSEGFNFVQKFYELPNGVKSYEITLEVGKYGNFYDETWEVFDDYKGVVRPIRVISSVKREKINDKVVRLEARLIELEKI